MTIAKMVDIDTSYKHMGWYGLDSLKSNIYKVGEKPKTYDFEYFLIRNINTLGWILGENFNIHIYGI
jgi:hypothetical protein